MSTKSGFHYVLNGFSLMLKPKIRRFVIIPLLLNLPLFAGLVWFGLHEIQDFQAWLIRKLPDWLNWLSILLEWAFLAVYVTLLLYVFALAGNLFAAPFNALLSEQVECYLTQKTPPQTSTWSTVKDVPRTIARQFAVIFYYLPRIIALLILFLIPVAQIIAPILWLLFNAWSLSLQYFDYPADNHRVSFEDMREKLREKPLDTLSFGFMISLLALVPVVNILLIPAAVCGATQAWVEKTLGPAHKAQGDTISK